MHTFCACSATASSSRLCPTTLREQLRGELKRIILILEQIITRTITLLLAREFLFAGLHFRADLNRNEYWFTILEGVRVNFIIKYK